MRGAIAVLKALFLLYLAVFSSFSYAQSPGSLLEELNLNTSQRSAIHAVLLGGMQSLSAINSQIAELDSSEELQNSQEALRMRDELLFQRVRKAESMAIEILGVLSDEQISKLNFGSFIESLPSVETEAVLHEFEI